MVIGVATGDDGQLYVINMRCLPDGNVYLEIEDRIGAGVQLKLHLGSGERAVNLVKTAGNALVNCYTPRLGRAPRFFDG